jgi:catechol 2,3-dioxygenase-like lactoylglutathione lyase family enzyme
MAVKRIVANFAVDGVDRARAFYGDVLGLEVAMDLGWILTFESGFKSHPQVSVATQGGSGTSVPELSVEVDNLDEVYQKAWRKALRWNTDPSPSLGRPPLLCARPLRAAGQHPDPRGLTDRAHCLPARR